MRLNVEIAGILLKGWSSIIAARCHRSCAKYPKEGNKITDYLLCFVGDGKETTAV
jgi:hypothetical protein